MRCDPHPLLQPQDLEELLYLKGTQTLLRELVKKVLNNQIVLL